MTIHWKNQKLKTNLESCKFLESQYDKKVAKSVVTRLKQIEYSESYDSIPPNAHKHPIKKGKKILYFAVDLPNIGGGRGKWRLIFEPYGEYDLLDYKSIVEVRILRIENYHK
jgi:hypothetical protein